MSLSISHPNLPHASAELVSFSRHVSQRIQSYLQSTPGASEAAQDILRSFYAEIEALALDAESVEEAANDVEGPLDILWTTVLEIAVQIPHDHPGLQHLIALLACIKTQPTPTEPTVSALVAEILLQFQQTWGQTFWTGLPGFGMAVHETQSRDPADAEEHVNIGGRTVNANLGISPYSRDEWRSLQKFLRLCKSEGVMDLQLAG